ncbi:hypothetical protein [Umezawaea sp. Da 62-37]|uniref:hypothetical protein n=1 Tax=Umezawaea sp. Da 62-37 TaxID=3075927 RepID=UPI0028F6E158|nr:hypothetical protein [Umezawaea sp. Da 62-37]WNV83913.1 hypothetical protein RM788_37975 [Umezawaea sp. Da 62-37]
MPTPCHETDVLVAELKELRRGRGVLRPEVKSNLGHLIGALCGISAKDDEGEARAKLLATLSDLASELPEDLRICFTAAFALTEEARLPFYLERLEWAGTRLGREVRTVRRRVDESLLSVAQLVSGRQARRPTLPWHTSELTTTVSLTDGEVFETRRVVADRTSVTELDLGWSLTPSEGGEADVDGVWVQVIHGGSLVHRSRKASARIATTVRLSKPLEIGQEAEIGLRITPNGTPLRHYVCTPHGRCDRFTLRVVFTVPPQRVLVVDGVPAVEVEDDLTPRRALPVGRSREFSASFTDLVAHLSYGLRWC